MNRFFVFFALCLILGFSSCIDASKIKVTKFTDIETKGIGTQNMSVDLGLMIDNGNSTLKLKEAKIIGYQNGEKTIEIWSDSTVKIKKGETEITLPLRIKLHLKNGGFFGLLSFYNDLDKIKFDVSIKGGVFLFSEKIEYKQITLKELETLLGSDIKNIIKN